MAACCWEKAAGLCHGIWLILSNTYLQMKKIYLLMRLKGYFYCSILPVTMVSHFPSSHWDVAMGTQTTKGITPRTAGLSMKLSSLSVVCTNLTGSLETFAAKIFTLTTKLKRSYILHQWTLEYGQSLFKKVINCKATLELQNCLFCPVSSWSVTCILVSLCHWL